MSDNPYQATHAMTDMSDLASADPQLERTVSMLRQTKPWVRFISVMMFIGSVFMVFAGIAMMVSMMAAGIGAVIGFLYIGMALMYVIPAHFLWTYANRISLFMDNPSTGSLALALEAQKSFWKFVGICMLVIMVIYAVSLMFLIGGSAISTM